MGVEMADRKLRVGYISRADEKGGGAEEALLDVLRYIDRDRIEPVLFHAERAEWLRDLGEQVVETHVIFPEGAKVFGHSRDAVGGLGARFTGTVQSVKPISDIRQALIEHQIDIVHTNDLKCHVLGGIAARMARRPLVWDVRDILEPGKARNLLVQVARMTKPHIVAMSGAVSQSLAPARCDTTIVLGARPIAKFRPLSPSHALRTELKLGVEDRVVVVIARLTPWKGHKVLLNAFSQVMRHEPNARLLVIGEPAYWNDSYPDELRQMAEDLRCAEAVRWLGHREDIPELLALAELLVLPSRDEPFGLVLIEAMAAGKPTIATRSAGPVEITVEGNTGLLVEHGNVDELAAAIGQLLADPERARKMGEAGRRRAVEMFDIPRLVDELYGVYERVL